MNKENKAKSDSLSGGKKRTRSIIKSEDVVETGGDVTGYGEKASQNAEVNEASIMSGQYTRKRGARVKSFHAGSVLGTSVSKSENKMTTIEKMEATRQGISKKELEELKKKTGLDYDQLSHMLNVARATLIGKKGTGRFSPVVSEKIMSLADIYSYGYEVFGSEEEFNRWIFQPIAAFGGKAPYALLDNQYGREEVKHVIGRIDYGVYS